MFVGQFHLPIPPVVPSSPRTVHCLPLCPYEIVVQEPVFHAYPQRLGQTRVEQITSLIEPILYPRCEFGLVLSTGAWLAATPKQAAISTNSRTPDDLAPATASPERPKSFRGETFPCPQICPLIPSLPPRPEGSPRRNFFKSSRRAMKAATTLHALAFAGSVFAAVGE